MRDRRGSEPFDSIPQLITWSLENAADEPTLTRLRLAPEHLVTAARIDEWLERGQITSASLAFSRENVAVPLDSFSSDMTIQGARWPFLVSPAKARRLVAEGHSLVLSGPELWDVDLRRLSLAIAESSLCELNTMIFLTPARATGFFPHRDRDDLVVVIQTEGTKAWRLYDASPDNWQEDDPTRPTPNSLTAELELTLGDVLIVPRGWGHAASATDSLSVHLSLGVNRVDISHVYRVTLTKLLSAMPRETTWEETRDLFAEIEAALKSCDPASVLRDFVTAQLRPDSTRLDSTQPRPS